MAGWQEELILAARCLGWLDTHPKDGKGEKLPHSRREQIKLDGGKLPDPPVTLHHLLTALLELGVCAPTGMGVTAIAASEMLAWQQGAGVKLSPWEFSAIRAASRAYVAEYYAENPNPPYGDASSLMDEQVVQSRIDRMFE